MTIFPAFANALPPNLAILEKEPANLKEIEKLADYRWFEQALNALKNYSDSGEDVLFLKARCFMGLKNYKKSLELFHKITETTSSSEMHREALLKEAMVLVRLKRYDESLGVYDRLISENRAKKRWVKEIAKRAFKTALESKKYDGGLKFLKHLSGHEAQWWRGWCYFRLQDPHAALRNWDMISKKSGYYPQALYWKAQVFRQRSEEEKSKKILDFLVGQFPFNYYGILALLDAGTRIPPLEEGMKRIQLEEKYPRHFRHDVEKESKKRRLDPYFVFAVIWQESRFREWVVSPMGAIGLMQLMPQTALSLSNAIKLKHFEIAQILEPEMNIKLGSFYLSFLRKLFVNQIPLVIAAYNAGEEAVSRWVSLRKRDQLIVIIEEIPYDETQKYTKRVLLAHWIYRWLYKGDVPSDF